MQHRDPQELPEDLRPVAEWLRAQRPEVNALELDRIKQRARVQAMGAERTGPGIARARRPLATALTALVLTVSLGGALAIAGKAPPSSPSTAGSSHGSAAVAQYCPPGKAGEKCRGEREKECLKQAEADKKAFEKQQEQEKKAFEQQQAQAKKDFEATHPTAQQRKAFDQQQKQEKKAFEQQQAQARTAFLQQYEAQKEACEEEDGEDDD